MHVVIQLIVSLITKLDLFQINFDTDVTNIHVLKAEILLQPIRAFVGNVTESVKQLLRPVFEQRDLGHESFTQVRHELLERLSFLDLKEILVVVYVCHVIKAKIARTVFREKKFFCGANLIKELRQQLIVLKAFRNLVALDWETLITAVGKLLNDTTLVTFDDSYGLFTVVNRAHTFLVEFSLE